MSTKKQSLSAVIMVCSLAAVCALIVLSGSAPAQAAVTSAPSTTPASPSAMWVVTSSADSGAGTLRDAIAAAAAGDTITFNGDMTITLSSELAIAKSLTITGAGHAVTVSGGGTTRVFNVSAGTVTFDTLNIINGHAPGGQPCGYALDPCGGGIKLLNSSVMVNVSNSTLSGNLATAGGGIYNIGGTLNVSNTTFSSNLVYSGGGIESYGGTLNVTNSTFSGNSANYGGGGGIFNWGGTMNVTNSTFSGNSVTYSSGGGIYNYSGTMTVKNSIVANSSGSNCNGTIGGSANLASDGTCGASFTNSSTILLGALGNYGGSTRTMPLLPGSSAIDGTNTNCPAQDQRGVARPQGAACDVGAFESRGFTLAKSGGDNQSTPINTAFATPLSVTLSETGGNGLAGVVITFTAPAAGASLAAPVTVTASTNASGIASLPVIANGNPGPYTVTASASGVLSVVGFALTNLKGTTAISVTAAPNPSLPGKTVTFTATVTSASGIPTGNITFTVDTVNLGPLALTNGVATYVTNTLAVGAHAVSAQYNGDNNFNLASLPTVIVITVEPYRLMLPVIRK